MRAARVGAPASCATVLLRETRRSVYAGRATWGELVRRLKAAGFVEHRTGKGSHRQFIHAKTARIVTGSVHTRKDVGTGLAARVLKDAGP
jgi:predicted RNA binding protein YcfA (HicA-like mRNA interferase family)